MKHPSSSAEEVFGYVGGDASQLGNFRAGWEESAAAMPKRGPCFLQPGFGERRLRFIGTENAREIIPDVERAIAGIRKDPRLAAYAWHCYRRLLLADDADFVPPGDWPRPAPLGADGGMLFLLLAVAAVPLARKSHAAWGVPASVTRATMSQIPDRVKLYFRPENGGRAGMELPRLKWYRNYVKKPYFRLGRLEFCLEPWRGGMQIWRNVRDGRAMAFPDAGTSKSSRKGSCLTVATKSHGLRPYRSAVSLTLR